MASHPETTKSTIIACIFGAAMLFALAELATGFWIEAHWHCEPSDMLCAIDRHQASWSHMMRGHMVAVCGLLVVKVSGLFKSEKTDAQP